MEHSVPLPSLGPSVMGISQEGVKVGVALKRWEATLERGLHRIQRALTGSDACSRTILAAAVWSRADAQPPEQYGTKSNSGISF